VPTGISRTKLSVTVVSGGLPTAAGIGSPSTNACTSTNGLDPVMRAPMVMSPGGSSDPGEGRIWLMIG
jgi:hypothetical protein